ncbi:MAG: FMN-dependent NADH-azoreductase [Oceanicaulis sp.]|nr:FMN-dependent NADH-azoreductase [Oceanicaulis sp.]MBB01011.1 FMN-dependent NADH-azoreductase [Planctomyces sp.]MBB01027.1 FMN-dependent NADH-azoreductase [Planctomyces sp.]|tara:strand:+ start:4118 stop:4738 length:621 start_codon:yes stop_codon:yes gene_type:complete
MAVLLNVQSSPDLEKSASRAVSKAFIDRYVAAHPDTKVVDLDLVATPPTHFGPTHLRAFFATGDEPEPENQAALAASDTYVSQLIDADVVVLGTPMHNFSVASTMKSWIDNILRVGKTFQYSESGPVGLLSDKKVVVVVGSGGIYSEGPMSAFEHCGNYLRDILTVIGLTDTTILRAEGLAFGPEAAEQGLAKGFSEAESLADQMG